jgi:hypothetical protein
MDAGFLILGVIIGTVITYTPLKLWAQYIDTIFHELGHATVGVLLGKKLKGFKLYANTSGMTITMSNGYGIRGMLTSLAGYPSPIVFSTTMLMMAVLGYQTQTMYILAGVSVYMFLFARNLFAIVPLATLFGLAILGINTGSSVSLLVIGVLSSILMIKGYKSLTNLYKYLPVGSDATNLSQTVGGKERFWIVLMMVLSGVNGVLIPYGVYQLLNAVAGIPPIPISLDF